MRTPPSGVEALCLARDLVIFVGLRQQAEATLLPSPAAFQQPIGNPSHVTCRGCRGDARSIQLSLIPSLYST